MRGRRGKRGTCQTATANPNLVIPQLHSTLAGRWLFVAAATATYVDRLTWVLTVTGFLRRSVDGWTDTDLDPSPCQTCQTSCQFLTASVLLLKSRPL